MWRQCKDKKYSRNHHVHSGGMHCPGTWGSNITMSVVFIWHVMLHVMWYVPHRGGTHCGGFMSVPLPVASWWLPSSREPEGQWTLLGLMPRAGEPQAPPWYASTDRCACAHIVLRVKATQHMLHTIVLDITTLYYSDLPPLTIKDICVPSPWALDATFLFKVYLPACMLPSGYLFSFPSQNSMSRKEWELSHVELWLGQNIAIISVSHLCSWRSGVFCMCHPHIRGDVGWICGLPIENLCKSRHS